MKRAVFLSFIAFFIMVMAPTISGGTIVVKFDPSTTNVTVGSSFEVDLLADIPEDDSISGFGLDLIYDDALLSFDDFERNISLFPRNEHGGLDTVPIEGLVGWGQFPSIASGQDVLLGTIYFTCLGAGVSSLGLVKNDDPWVEYGFWNITGFVTPNVGREWTYEAAEIVQAPVPEPATMLLLASGLAGLAAFRRRFKR